MRNGKYVVDSIENSLVKLLYSENEEIEEVISIGTDKKTNKIRASRCVIS